MHPREQVSLAAHTTLGVGGPARYWLEAEDDAAVVRALAWAAGRGLAVTTLGGGSNVLVADRGLDALVLRPRMLGLSVEREPDALVVEVGAGRAWDELVAWSVAEGAAGLECLSGIPGEVGAAPIQNIGAYGQEVGAVVLAVRVVDRATGATEEVPAARCAFGYRDSAFKREPGRSVVTAVRFRLALGRAAEPAPVAYAELATALGPGPRTLADVRRTVLELRRKKSMVHDPADENARSAGSFFVNPSVSAETALRVAELAAPLLGPGERMPRHPTSDGRVKLAAAWLIERSGLPRGTLRGRVGLSPRHALALGNRGGASAAELVAFAAEVRARVRERFGVALEPEVRLLGFTDEELRPLVA
ncbi:MAG: UDP-N-acetylmuramate dehydrogenase [Myxococcales bacterium]|nr:UDP-N-acetylmuramate dehydrogenase [Myxococcales bacterium]